MLGRGLPHKLALLVACGNSICGNSAIVAAAPVIEAESEHVTASIAFTAGVVPLVLATGAGSEMRQAMGVAVFYGMLGVTFFGLLFTPVFYMFMTAFGKKPITKKDA